MILHGISNAQLITPDGVIPNGAVLWDENGRLTHISPSPLPVRPDRLDAAGRIVAPGFIDLQINGGFGHDFTAAPETIWAVAAQLPRYGVTRFLPTLITAPLDRYRRAQHCLAAGPPSGWRGARPLGWHFEGPFLNPGKKGAHNPAGLRQPTLAAVENWTPVNGVRLVTLAPELPGATAVIRALTQRGVVVGAGHSLATLAQAQQGIDNGIRYGTHLCNAMRPLHHREPGLVGALLNDDRITIGLITDGIHLHPALIKLLWSAAGPRLNLVTDAMAALGMPPGTYHLGDRPVTVRDEGHHDCLTARLEEGTLAGSVLSLDMAVRNLRRFTGCSLAEAVATVTCRPADQLGLDAGKIQIGYAADLVLLDEDLTVQKTISGGRIVYAATGNGR